MKHITSKLLSLLLTLAMLLSMIPAAYAAGTEGTTEGNTSTEKVVAKAGENAAHYILSGQGETATVRLEGKNGVRYTVPQQLDPHHMADSVTVRFRVGRPYQKAALCVYTDGKLLRRVPKRILTPGEMEQFTLRREELPEGFEAAAFDYVKLGGWVEALGPLTAPTTNQRLYRIEPDGTMEDITKLFRRKP